MIYLGLLYVASSLIALIGILSQGLRKTPLDGIMIG
jgi:hypothetical protein